MYLNESVFICILFFNKVYKCIKKNVLKKCFKKQFIDFFFNLDLLNNVKYKSFEVKIFFDVKLYYLMQ